MDEIISKGYAEEIDEGQEDSKDVYYIPHHGVYHAKKDKIRVVFDCSARYEGTSLNDLLMQGPDLTNDLVSILCRFRREPIAIACDIQKMYYQFQQNLMM